VFLGICRSTMVVTPFVAVMRAIHTPRAIMQAGGSGIWSYHYTK
jgi:hypothetical protein